MTLVIWGWDGVPHQAGPVPAPAWYAALCIGVDAVVAWLLAVVTLRDRREREAVVA